MSFSRWIWLWDYHHNQDKNQLYLIGYGWPICIIHGVFIGRWQELNSHCLGKERGILICVTGTFKNIPASGVTGFRSSSDIMSVPLLTHFVSKKFSPCGWQDGCWKPQNNILYLFISAKGKKWSSLIARRTLIQHLRVTCPSPDGAESAPLMCCEGSVMTCL